MNRLITVFALSLAACATQAQKPAFDPNAARNAARDRAIAELNRNFERVHFEFDSPLLTEDSRVALADNADLLRDFPELRVEVQGHCDETGTSEYNLSLGDRRAEGIKKYLTMAGVKDFRISTISFGEELPIQNGHDNAAMANNRRAEFRVTIGSDAPVLGTVADNTSDKELIDPVAHR